MKNDQNNILLNEPFLTGNEKSYLLDCINSNWISTSGYYVNKFEQEVANYVDSRYAIACSSGTAALHIALKVLGISNNDEVIVPTVTFIATINAIRYNNASPVFLDVDNFYNIDVTKFIKFIDNQTYYKDGFTYNKSTNNKIKAVLPVHVWGNAVDLNKIIKICKEKNIKIIEDASESLGSKYNSGPLKNKYTGTIGDIGCFSFNGNKIITAGGGGMIVTNDKLLAEKSIYFTSQAKDDHLNFIHDEIGYNYRLTNLHAAVGLAQIEKVNEILIRKEEIFNFYLEFFSNNDKISLVPRPDYATNNHWLNIIRFKNFNYLDLKKIITYLNENCIQVRPIWQLNHLQKPYKNDEFFDIVNATKLIENSLCLPSSPGMSNDDLKRVCETINTYCI
jgi:perosamine synthetase|tara:strand:+ start:16656 stop:17831 length:1176 start_codon:yes stop_codon:yes gene_type:complete